MKDERKKYIIVDAKDINVALRKHERVFGFNDFWNEYPVCGETTAKEIFEQHQIPEQFQKIAFSLPTCPCCKSNGTEVLTGRNFTITKNKQHKEYFGDESARWLAGDVVGGSLRFRTPKKKERYNAVLSFYEQLTEEGYLDSYIAALKSMFFLEHELAFGHKQNRVEEKAQVLLRSRQKIKSTEFKLDN